MKNIILQLFFLLIYSFIKAQNPVPNPGFENWSGSPLSPDGWYSNGTASNVLVIQAPGHTGSIAAKGNVINFNGGMLVSPYLGSNFPVTQRYSSIQLFYKAFLDSDDVFQISAAIYDSSNNFLAGNYFNIVFSSASFTTYNLNLDSLGPGIPDHALITFTIIPLSPNPTPHINSYFVVDDVELISATTGINENTETDLYVFPNPAKKNIFIKSNWNKNKSARIVLYDCDGRIVLQKGTSIQSNGIISETLDVESINTGVYFLSITSERNNYFRKVIIE